MREFGDKERLRLQQLLTLRAITLDSRKESESGDEPGEPEESKLLPEIWRLLPGDFQPYDWQRECLTAWVGHEYRGTVKVATGGGKTRFALFAAQELQNNQERDLRLVIVVPTIVLMNQWYEELSGSNIPMTHVGRLGGEHTDLQDPNIRIIISVINSAREKLPALVEQWEWSDRLLLVVDECHRSNAPRNSRIFDSQPTYTLGLSATPEAGDEDAGTVADEAYAQSPVGEGIGPIIFEFSLADSLRAGLLTQFEVYHVGVSLTPKEVTKHEGLSQEISEIQRDLKPVYRRSRSTRGFFAWCQTASQRGGTHAGDAKRFLSLTRERKRLLYRAESRFELAFKILVAAMREPDRRVIVFHEEIDEINRLFRATNRADIPAVLEHSKLPDKLREENIELFRKGIARAIVSAKSLVEGFNVPSADVGIIAASSGSVRQRIQSLGRMLRKKPEVERAVIFALYVKESSDERIYEDADWEKIIGATNRYFELASGNSAGHDDFSLDDLLSGLTETRVPPRVYRPPCNEIPDETLVVGEEYPGQTKGLELKVDQMRNLRTNEDRLICVQREIIDTILDINEYRRAIRTPCGHLISKRSADSDGEWVFVGWVGEPTEPSSAEEAEKLYVKQRRGRREIVRRLRNGDSVFALGPDRAQSKAAGETRDVLLRWVTRLSAEYSVEIRHLYWEGENRFYVEVDGECVYCRETPDGLEFPGPDVLDSKVEVPDMKPEEFEQWEACIGELTDVQCHVGRAVLGAKLEKGAQKASVAKSGFVGWLMEISGQEADLWREVLSSLGWESAEGAVFKWWLTKISDMTLDQCREALVVLNAKRSSPAHTVAQAEVWTWLSGIGDLTGAQRLRVCIFIAKLMRMNVPEDSRTPTFLFIPERQSFPYWKGPYSPARGNTSGFRVRNGRLGFCVGDERNFRAVVESDGTRELGDLVRRNWGGGRVLFLPSGHIIKPLQEEDERGLRVLIGRYEGGFSVFHNGSRVDLSPNSSFTQGSHWQEPTTIGLECTIKAENGHLTTRWIEPAEWGDNEYDESIGSDPHLARGFRICRPGHTGGRVRITVGCHVITNRQVGDRWQCFYAGRADPDLFLGWDRWIARDWS